MRRVVRALALAAGCLSPVVAAAGPGSAGGASLLIGKLPIGPRATALAGACVALGDEPAAIGWNPAGIAGVPGPEASAIHVELGQDVRLESLAVAQPMPLGGTLGIAGSYLNLPQLVATLEDSGGGYAGIGNVVPAYAWKASVAYAQDLGALAPVAWLGPLWDHGAVGGALTYLNETIAGTVAQAPAADLGYRFHDPNEGFGGGLALRSLGPPANGSPLPVTFEGGLAQDFDAWTLTADFLSATDDGYRIRFGAEWGYVMGAHKLTLRGGWQHSFASELQGPFAAGLSYRFTLPGSLAFTLDYAFQPVHGFDNVHALAVEVGL